MIILAYWLLSFAPVTPVSSSNAECMALNERELRSKVGAISRKRGGDVAAMLAELDVSWRSACLNSRRAASSATVDSLASLLRMPIARLTVADMLLDVSGNLHRAAPEVRTALKNEEARERNYERRAYPFIPTNLHNKSTALRCILSKIETGKVDAVLCRYLRTAN